MAQGFEHSRFDSRSLATTIHREFFEQTLGLPSRETKTNQRFSHGFGRPINKGDGPTECRRQLLRHFAEG
jgi:hypothetical protein